MARDCGSGLRLGATARGVFHLAQGDGEDAAGQDVALRQGDVGVVVGEVGESLGRRVQHGRQSGGRTHADLEHLQLAVEEQVAASGAAQGGLAAGAQQVGQGGELIFRTASVEAGGEVIVVQGVHLAGFVEQPEDHAGAAGIDIEEPAGEGGHAYCSLRAEQ